MDMFHLMNCSIFDCFILASMSCFRIRNLLVWDIQNGIVSTTLYEPCPSHPFPLHVRIGKKILWSILSVWRNKQNAAEIISHSLSIGKWYTKSLSFKNYIMYHTEMCSRMKLRTNFESPLAIEIKLWLFVSFVIFTFSYLKVRFLTSA